MAETDEDIIKEARERFERCVAWESNARQNALLDAKFEAGDSINQWQWDPAVLTARAGRPCLTENKTRQNNLLIVNDGRQNKAQIKVTPTGGHATYEAAQIFSGIIRRIEYQSKAVDAYSTAMFHQVSTGIGYVRVVTDWADETDFDQDIFIRRVADPKTIYLDPDAKDYDKADMRFAFVFVDVPRDVYEAEHGEGDMPPATTTLDNAAGWNDKDHIRTAEYWRRGEKTDTLYRLIDGTVFRKSDLPPADLARIKPLIVAERDVSVPEVECFKLCGDRVDERKSWAGKYIPLVPFIGEETVIEGMMDRKGHTRSQIDAQRMLNYWSSAAVEHVALQGKSPFVGDFRAFEDHEAYWQTANTQNWPYLPFNGVDKENGLPIERPARQAPPEMPQAYIAGLQMAKDALMFTTGQYQANLGAPSNETSGIAIQRRQRQGDLATAHYIDNQAKAIRQIGRICLDLIPHIYDVERVTMIMAEDETSSEVHIDPSAPEAHQHMVATQQGSQPITPGQAKSADDDDSNPADVRVIFNPSIGKYEVEADVGASYATQRQEAANAFSMIMAQNPEAFQIVGDFWAKNSDFPGADELAARLKRGLPAIYKAGPDPQTMQVQQQAHELLGKADAEIAELKQKLAAMELQAKDKSGAVDNATYDAETRRLVAVAQADPGVAQVIYRSMLSQMLGMPAVPIIHEHQAADAAHQQEIAPPDADQGAMQAAQ